MTAPDAWLPPGSYIACNAWALENRLALEAYAQRVEQDGTAAEQLQAFMSFAGGKCHRLHAALTFLYGTAFTIMFTVLPRLGVVGNSAIMNIEPIFALGLAWLILGQAIAPVQVAGGLLVVATVMWLGWRRR